MPNWKRVRISFPTVKLGPFIEPVKKTVANCNSDEYRTVYGVTNVEGIAVTGKLSSKDISKYITIERGCFAYNPYRVNVGSIGYNSTGVKGCVSPAYVVFKTKNNLSPEFLYTYLKSEFGHHLINWYGNRGGVRNALRYDDLCNVDIPDIDYGKQQELLTKIDKCKISLNSFNDELSKQLVYLTKLRQAILQEAIEGKLTAEWRKQHSELINGENCTSKLLERIHIEKIRHIKQSKIRKEKPLYPIQDSEKPFVLPHGWTWCRLGEVSHMFGGYAYDSTTFKKDGVNQVLRLGNIRSDYLRLDAKAIFIDDNIANSTKDFKLRPNDILITMTGTRAKRDYLYTVLLDEQCIAGKKLFLNQRVGCIRPLLLDNRFMNMLLKHDLLLKPIFESATGSANQANIGMVALRNLCVPLPPLPEQRAIVEYFHNIGAIVNEMAKQGIERKERAEMLMQSVLREAFSTGCQ